MGIAEHGIKRDIFGRAQFGTSATHRINGEAPRAAGLRMPVRMIPDQVPDGLLKLMNISQLPPTHVGFPKES